MARKPRTRGTPIALDHIQISGPNYSRTQTYVLPTFEPVLVDIDRHLGTCLSNLQTVESGEYEKEYDSRDVIQCRKIEDGTIVGIGASKEVFDIARFKKAVQEVYDQIEKWQTEKWIENGLFFPLGPDSVKNVVENDNEVLSQIQYRLLIHRGNGTIYLVADSTQLPQWKRERFTNWITPRSVKEDNVSLCFPDGDFVMALKYGSDPIHRIPRDSRCLLTLEPQQSFQWAYGDCPKKYYKNILKSSIKSTRLLDFGERKYLAQEMKDDSLIETPIRLLEFFTSGTCNHAKLNSQLQVVESVIVDSLKSLRTLSAETHMLVSFESGSSGPVQITLAESDPKANLAFEAHGLSFGKPEFHQNGVNMTISGFPTKMKSRRTKESFLRDIAKANSFEIVSISSEEDSSISFFDENDLIKKTKAALEYLINAEFGNRSRAEQGADMSKMRDFTIRRMDEESLNRRSFIVNLNQVPLKNLLIDSAIQYFRQGKFLNRGFDDLQVTLLPVIQRGLSVRREIRVALDEELKKFNNDCQTYSQSNNDNQVGLYEEWRNGEETGTIGVQCLNPQFVENFFQQLQQLFIPKEYDVGENKDLLFGVGEVFVRSLKKKYNGKVVIDIDKFKSRILLIGSATEEAIQDLQMYKENKNCIIFKTELNVGFPWFNQEVSRLLTPSLIVKLKETLGIEELDFDEKCELITFVGTIQAYEMLVGALEDINDAIFKKKTAAYVAEDIPFSSCAACLTEVGKRNDYFRLQCGHTMCRDCINGMVQSSMNDSSFVIECAVEECKFHVSPSEIVNIVFGGWDRVYDFDSFKSRFFIARAQDAVVRTDQNIRYCPRENCTGLRIRSHGPTDEAKNCNVCDQSFCRGCLGAHHRGITCQEQRELMIPDRSIAAYERDNVVKKCPKCENRSEKSEGCNHMECTCGAHYCWVCLYLAANSGDCYRHMTEAHGGNGL